MKRKYLLCVLYLILLITISFLTVQSSITESSFSVDNALYDEHFVSMILTTENVLPINGVQEVIQISIGYIMGASFDGFAQGLGANPPFWQTWWFYIIVLFIIIYCGYHYRIAAIQRNYRALEKSVKERTRELEKANQELTQLITEKNKMNRVLAHDLRTPIASIIGYLEILRNDFKSSDDEEKLRMANMILNSGKNTLDLLENLLLWSNYDGKRIDPVKRPVHIDKLIYDVINATELQASFKDVKVINVNETDVTITLDQNMISSVLRNLVINAIKFSKRDSKITIDVENNQDHIIVSVTDEGIGMDESHLEHLFNYHEQQSKTGTGGEKGAGLGLLICKDFVERHDGQIWADSKPDAGTTVYFTIKKS